MKSEHRSERLACVALVVLLLASAGAHAEERLFPGPNVNMVSGTEWPEGDPFLQRQNEPSEAVSTRNTMRLMGFGNDYRTVDIPGLPDGITTGDSWLGVFKSLDGGLRWKSTLLPGYPQDETEVGQTSPLYGYQAGADPVVRAGTHGLFYLSGIVFDRGDLPRSAVFVTRYMDLDNKEFGDPIEYIDTTRVDFDEGLTFIDKPWLAVDIPRGELPDTIIAVPQDGGTVDQTVQCGNVYLVWAVLEGTGPASQSTIFLSRSTDCGSTWSSPISLSNPGTLNQGATIAVSPATGDVWVAWRQFDTTSACTYAGGYWKKHPEDWPVDTMIMGGVTYTKDALIEILETPSQGDGTYIVARHLIAAKLNVRYGSNDDAVADTIIDTDNWLVGHPIGSDPSNPARQDGIALAGILEAYNEGIIGAEDCVSGGDTDNAILAVRSTDGGQIFSPPEVVAPLHPFDQGTSVFSFRTNSYPTMTVDDTGRAYLAWATRGFASPRTDIVDGDSRVVLSTSIDGLTWSLPYAIDQPCVPGHQVKPSLAFAGDKLLAVYYDLRRDVSGVFDRYIADLPTDPPVLRHTVDVRAAAADPGVAPVFTVYTLTPETPSDQVSRYECLSLAGTDPPEITQLQYNPPNLPMFVGGTVPFFGDYIDIAGSPPFLPSPDGWTYNTEATDGAIFHAVWTDDRDVEPPGDGDWTNYIPPTHANSGSPSLYDPNETVPTCYPDTADEQQSRIRNQNIYTCRMSQGLYVATPGIAKPLGLLPGTGDLFQRAFVLFVRNDTDLEKSFRLEIADPPPAPGTASFLQFSGLTTVDVTVGPYSSVARSVFVTSDQDRPTVRLEVAEIDAPGGTLVVDGLQSSVLLNGDESTPPPADLSLRDAEIYNPSIMNPSIMNPSIMNPSIMNPSIMNPSIMNPSIMNPSIMNPSIMNPSIMNLAVYNPSIMNPSIMNPSIMNPSIMNGSLRDVTWEVENTGNTTAAYTVNMMLDNPPTGFIYQLMIYRTYETPIADGCTLTEEAQHQLLVNVLDPDLSPTNLLDPNITSPDLNNAAFFLAPQDRALITLRVIDPDEDDEIEFDPAALSTSVVAHSVNTAAAQLGETQPAYAAQLSPAIPPLVITTTTLPDGTLGDAYSETLAATGGQGARSWSVAPGSGPLPDGITLDGSGHFSGTPNTAGTYNFTVRVSDDTQITSQALSLEVIGEPVVPSLHETAKLTAGDAAAGDRYGLTVSISGNTAVVGADGDDSYTGSAYVYVRSGSSWIQQAKLTASDATTDDYFGHSVSISGDTVVVGAPFDDDTAFHAGSLYVFVRSGTTWTQQAKLTASDATAHAYLGSSVSISGDRVVAGAYGDDSFTGSAYVFVRSGTSWTQQAKLSASDAMAGDFFGYTVSISGETAVVGAHVDDSYTGSAYVFVGSGTSWTQQAKLTASDATANDWFGQSVSINSDTAVVGAPLDDDPVFDSGSAYVFVRTGTSWTQQAKLTASDVTASANFGSSVSMSGDRVVVGAQRDGSYKGSARVFVRSGTTWTQQAKLTASDGTADDSFGHSVSISGCITVVGAYYDDDAGSESGSAYLFDLGFTEAAKLTAGDAAAGDRYGLTLSISGNTAVVGADGDDSYTGSAYVYVRSGSSWIQQAKLTASDATTDDYFGHSVSISGDTVVVGAPFDDDTAFNAGSLYVFVRSGTTWTQQAKLTASDATAHAYLGSSISISGDRVVAGAYGDDSFTGSAYVFVRSGTSWTQQAKLSASDAMAGDFFGYTVSISGETAVVGAHVDDSYTGSAYVFVGSGTSWTQQAKLTASDATANDWFGQSVSINSDTAVVGAPLDDDPTFDSGSAYVFVRTGTTWTQQAKLTASDVTASANFGSSVSISGDRVVVGAQRDGSYKGSARVFVRSGTTWTQQAKLTACDGTADDSFGHSVSINGDITVVGAYHDDDAGSESGSAYVFNLGFTEAAKLTASDAAADDQFGFSVSVSGNTAVVGAHGDDSYTGSAYVYVHSGSSWIQQAKLTASDGTAGDQFGISVSIDADTVVVGAPYDDDVRPESGSAYVFVRTGTTWTQQAKLTAGDVAAIPVEAFGLSVSIFGNTAVMGAPGDNDKGFDAGSAYVFVRSGTTWSQQDKLTASDAANFDQFGDSISISGDSVLVGATYDDNTGLVDPGSAYVFLRSGTTWAEQDKLTASDAEATDQFGRSVSISGNTAVVGSARNSDAGASSGSAYLFVRSGATWAEQAKITASDAAAGDQFGESVSISGHTAVIGARGDSEAGTQSGSVYVFVEDGPTWVEQAKLTASDAAAGDLFGECVSISGNKAVIGAWHDEDAGAKSGSAYVFDRRY